MTLDKSLLNSEIGFLPEGCSSILKSLPTAGSQIISYSPGPFLGTALTPERPTLLFSGVT